MLKIGVACFAIALVLIVSSMVWYDWLWDTPGTLMKLFLIATFICVIIWMLPI